MLYGILIPLKAASYSVQLIKYLLKYCSVKWAHDIVASLVHAFIQKGNTPLDIQVLGLSYKDLLVDKLISINSLVCSVFHKSGNIIF